MPPLTIDGAHLEGGGQILRTTASLSALLSLETHIHSIRAARSKTGLAAQHLASVNAVARVSGVTLSDAALGSTSLTFTPSGAPPAQGGLDFHDIQTAGSTALVLQALLPCLAKFVPSGREASVRGGTVALAAPHVDYLKRVLCPNLALLGLGVEVGVEKHGFFPKGGGEIRVTCAKPDERMLKAVDLTTRGVVGAVRGVVVVAGRFREREGEAVAKAAKGVLRKRLGIASGEIEIAVQIVPAEECMRGTVCSVTLWSEMMDAGGEDVLTTLGASALLERKGSPHGIGIAAADELCDAIDSGACLDSHMADQIAVYLAMATGTSKVLIGEPTLHTRTVVDVLRQFGINCTLRPSGSGGNYLLTCTGLALALEP